MPCGKLMRQSGRQIKTAISANAIFASTCENTCLPLNTTLKSRRRSCIEIDKQMVKSPPVASPKSGSRLPEMAVEFKRLNNSVRVNDNRYGYLSKGELPYDLHVHLAILIFISPYVSRKSRICVTPAINCTKPRYSCVGQLTKDCRPEYLLCKDLRRLNTVTFFCINKTIIVSAVFYDTFVNRHVCNGHNF